MLSLFYLFTMKRLFTLICVLMAFNALGQQQILVSQYMLNQYLINPAVAGTSDFFEASVGYRLQWAGLEGAPRTFYVTFQGPLGKAPEHYNWRSKKKYHHGVGASVMVDQTGLLSRTMAYLTYAYNMPINKKIRWSNGLNLGFQQHRIVGSKVIMDGFDVALPGVDINKIIPDVSVGSWLYSKDFYVGLAANQIMRNRLDYSVNRLDEIGRLKYHYFLTGGLRIPFYYNEMEWIPSVMLRYVHPAPMSFDLNSKIRYKKMYWVGVSYRHRDAVAALVGLTLFESLNIGYSYDLSISGLSSYHNNSHEFVLSYNIARKYDVLSPNRFW